MEARTQISVLGFAAIGVLLSSTAGALAHSPITLTDKQLDRVSAGAVSFVASTADAASSGVLGLTQTSGNSLIVGEPSLYPSQPGLAAGAGLADGVAVALGTNLGVKGGPAPGAVTAVQTGGAATGNLVINTGINYRVQGAGGVQFQAGWTFVYGAWVGL